MRTPGRKLALLFSNFIQGALVWVFLYKECSPGIAAAAAIFTFALLTAIDRNHED